MPNVSNRESKVSNIESNVSNAVANVSNVESNVSNIVANVPNNSQMHPVFKDTVRMYWRCPNAGRDILCILSNF